MDAYGLILEQGAINALKYAQNIDKKNHKLASEIDSAVVDIFRKFSQTDMNINQYQNMLPQQSNAPIIKQQVSDKEINQFVDDLHRKEELPNDRLIDDKYPLVNIIHNLVAAGYDFRLIKYSILTSKIPQLNSIINKLSTGTLNAAQQAEYIEQAGLILSKLPSRGFMPLTNSLRDVALNKIKSLGTVNPSTYNEIIHEAAGNLSKFTQPASSTPKTFLQNLIGKNQPASALNKMHPALAENTFYNTLKSEIQADLSAGNTGGSALNPLQLNKEVSDVIQSLKGKKPNEILEILKNRGLNNAAQTVEKQLSGAGVQISEDIAKSSLSTSESGAGFILKNLAKVFPGIEEFIPKLMPFLGLLAAFFEGKGLIEEIQEYGFDGKTICDTVGMITTVCSMIPPLAPYAIPVSLIAHGVCLFGFHHDPKNSNISGGQYITTDDVKKASETAQFSSLDPSDQKILQQLYKQYSNIPEQFSEELNKAKNANQFKNVLNSLGVAYRAIHGDATAIPTQKTSFNYKKYKLAHSN